MNSVDLLQWNNGIITSPPVVHIVIKLLFGKGGIIPFQILQELKKLIFFFFFNLNYTRSLKDRLPQLHNSTDTKEKRSYATGMSWDINNWLLPKELWDTGSAPTDLWLSDSKRGIIFRHFLEPESLGKWALM